MEYKVSEKIQKKFDTLTKDAKVQKALQFMENDQNEIINRQIELTLIPAPTNHEQKKAARLLEMFKEEGLTDCHIDEYGNCVGIRKGTGGGKKVLVEGHMDTVFPLDTKLEIVREDGFIKCPGIVDDTRGCATVLSTIRALNAAGRAIAKISEIQVPKEPMTTFAVTTMQAGSFEAVHAIVPVAQIRFNFRSNSQEELEKLRKKIFDAIDEACREETERWGMDTITYDVKHICDVNAGHQDAHAPIVEGAMAAAEYLGCEEPKLGNGGSTNCNRALEAGLPAVCLGMGADYDSHAHMLSEQFKVEGAYKGCQQTLLLALLCAGMDDVESIIEK